MSWQSEAEAELYRQTVHDNPRQHGEGVVAYAGRIADIVSGVLRRAEWGADPVGDMPKARS